MSKRNIEDGGESRSKRGKGGKGGKGGDSRNIRGLGNPKHYAFKVLCPDTLAAHLIGKEGKTRLQIEEESGAAVWISKREDTFPEPRYRLLILHADRPEQVLNALEAVVPRLKEVADRDREHGRDDLLSKDGNEYVFHCALPHMIAGTLIGKGGKNISDLEKDTGARVNIVGEKENFSGHRSARVTGSVVQITRVMQTLNTQVQEAADKLQPEFREWISCLPQGSPQGRRRSPPRRDRSPRRRDNRNQRRGRPVEEERPNEEGPRDDYYDEGFQEEWQDVWPDEDHAIVPHVAAPVDAKEMFGKKVVDLFPLGSLEKDHQITFLLPVDETPSDDFRRHVEEKTNLTRVEFVWSDDEAATEVQCTITGHLLDMNLAYLFIMKELHERRAAEEAARLRDEEAARLRREKEEDPKAADVAALQAQVAAMQRQLDLLNKNK